MGSDSETEHMPPEPARRKAPIVLAVVVILVAAAVLTVLLTGGSIQGEWRFHEVEIFNEDGSLNHTEMGSFEEAAPGTMELRPDGTATWMYPEANSTWEASDGRLRVTSVSPNYNITDTFAYEVSGRTLALETPCPVTGLRMRITFKRA